MDIRSLPEGERPRPRIEPPELPEHLPITQTTGPWWRIYPLAYEPLYFSRTRGRFGAPEGEYGVLYAARDLSGAVVETLGQTLGRRVIPRQELHTRGLAILFPGRSLRLVDLTGPGLHRMGIDAHLVTGEHHTTQQLSRALWQHVDQPDGILYRSRLDAELGCLALYDRALDAIRRSNVVRLGSLDGRRPAGVLAGIFERYGYTVSDDEPADIHI